MLKIYKHEGNGHYIGSCIIVVAENIVEATEIIKKILIDNGLKNEEINIVEIEIKDCLTVYVNNGDY